MQKRGVGGVRGCEVCPADQVLEVLLGLRIEKHVIRALFCHEADERVIRQIRLSRVLAHKAEGGRPGITWQVANHLR